MLEVQIAVVQWFGGGQRAGHVRMLTTPVLFHMRPRRLPSLEVHAAVQSVATPGAFLWRPALLPALVACIAVEHGFRGSWFTATSGMLTAPGFLRCRPTVLPRSCILLTVKWIATTIHLQTAPVFLVIRPTFLPACKACIAIEGCWRVLWNATTAMIAAAIGLLMVTPELMPVEISGVAVKGL